MNTAIEKPKTILIIEDDESLAEAIKHEFEVRGFQILLARNVSDALSFLEKGNSVDIVWLDHYLLGRANGLDFVARIKNHEEWKNIPIFVVSNSSSGESVRSYVGLGVSQYYTKSDYDLAEIISDIEKEIAQKKHVS